VWLTGRTHHGTGSLAQPKPVATHAQVQLGDNSAHDFDPLGTNGEHPNEVGLAVDGQPDTKWTTETYQNGQLGKAGVGVYVDAAPGVAARTFRIDTSTPGFAVQIFASNTRPELKWPSPAWHLVGTVPRVKRRQDIPLTTGGTRYRYYLMWITTLGANNGQVNDQVAINELALYT
jgi:serine/threonine-protein kinase